MQVPGWKQAEAKQRRHSETLVDNREHFRDAACRLTVIGMVESVVTLTGMYSFAPAQMEWMGLDSKLRQDCAFDLQSQYFR